MNRRKRRIGMWALPLFLIGMLFLSYDQKSRMISRINFPETAGAVPDNLVMQLQIPDEKKALLGQALPVYKIVPRRTDENYDQEILDLFDFIPDEIDKEDDCTTYKIGNFDKCLTIYQNGCFFYRIDFSNYSEIPLTMTDDEILSEGEAYLRSKNLLPENFYVGSQFGGITRGAPNEEGSFYMVKTMGYFQEIDGYAMLGRSDVSIGFWEGGIAQVSSVYSNYTFDRNIVCKSYEQVVSDAKEYAKHGSFTYDMNIIKSEIETIVLNDVEIRYYDSPINQPENTHIQPCYRFSGSATDQEGNVSAAYWTIQAVPEEFIL